MSPTAKSRSQRNIGDRYRELLLARGQLEQIIDDPKLNPFPDEPDAEVAIDKLRQAVRFEARGANAFRITYTDSRSRPREARHREAHEAAAGQGRGRCATSKRQATVDFATQQKETASTELRKREQALAEFLAKHPEFAQDANRQPRAPRCARSATPQADRSTGQHAALRARAPARSASRRGSMRRPTRRRSASPRRRRPRRSPPRRTSARRSASSRPRNRELEEALLEVHRQAPDRDQRAGSRRRGAAAAAPRAGGRAARCRDRRRAGHARGSRRSSRRSCRQLENQIADEQKRSAQGRRRRRPTPAPTGSSQLETEHADLRRAVNEERERVEALADERVPRADRCEPEARRDRRPALASSTRRSSPVKPSRPRQDDLPARRHGAVPRRSACALAVGLAVIDDRLYRRADLDQLGIARARRDPAGRSREDQACKPPQEGKPRDETHRPDDSAMSRRSSAGVARRAAAARDAADDRRSTTRATARSSTGPASTVRGVACARDGAVLFGKPTASMPRQPAQRSSPAGPPPEIGLTQHHAAPTSRPIRASSLAERSGLRARRRVPRAAPSPARGRSPAGRHRVEPAARRWQDHDRAQPRARARRVRPREGPARRDARPPPAARDRVPLVPPWCFAEQLAAHRHQPMLPWSLIEIPQLWLHVARDQPADREDAAARRAGVRDRDGAPAHRRLRPHRRSMRRRCSARPTST